MSEVTMEKIVSLAKRRGFIYPGSEIYGGLSGTWDYGPLGVELKNNIKNLWWRMFVQDREDMVGVDAAVIMNPKVWEASGHVGGFADPSVKCKKCGETYRVDQIDGFSQHDYDVVQKEYLIKFTDWIKALIKESSQRNQTFEEKARKAESILEIVTSEKVTQDQKKAMLDLAESLINELKILREAGTKETKIVETLDDIVQASNKLTGLITGEYLRRYVRCPNCDSRDWDTPIFFNMMFKTQIGASEGSIAYLRPETAGGIFVNFKNVIDSLHPKLPFGIAQIGKAFRNEIAPRDFVFRSREFEQMEIEYFVRPSEWEGSFEEWRKNVHAFNEAVGITREAVHELEVADGDRAHYSKRTIDFEFDFPFGRKELYGLAYRTDFDLSAHAKGSGQNLAMQDQDGAAIVPHVIEPSFGVERTILAVLLSAYTEDELGGESRTYLKFNKAVAPIKAAVFPLLKNKPELVAKAKEVYGMLKKEVPQVMWDDNGNIGKRYRRQDEIGTPVCITIDFDTLENDTVTVRDRDTGAQERVLVGDLVSRIQ
jgi:glycyl-tRNA synthetase